MFVRLHLQRDQKDNQTVQTLITAYYGISAIATQTYSTEGGHSNTQHNGYPKPLYGSFTE
jgi:hypothetical protein